MLGLKADNVYINDKLVSLSSIIRVYRQMGCKEYFFMLSKFKKSFLPPFWNVLFTILFRCFTERVSGLDNANKVFHTLIYSLYTNKKVDLGQIL